MPIVRVGRRAGEGFDRDGTRFSLTLHRQK
jgi:hypothetical protein